ncbi:MAG: hypothetical protein A2038_14960 [Deltaproteobacteria bacterium GWA2_57_13]|nr:MAG: hypothetical protein A2038_14960 [Deltaproteobacteria bacterium GWA2_57_13]OGQ75207.1 MAG: hypothetical protein A3G40_13950 [Deltaproteobacteria bacterium RIFCSPLOWO2_12_FULL_57_22]
MPGGKLGEHESLILKLFSGVKELKKIVDHGVKTYASFNNHYAGFAPGSAQLFEEIWQGER